LNNDGALFSIPSCGSPFVSNAPLTSSVITNFDSLDKIENKTSSLKNDESVSIDKNLSDGVSYIQKLRSLGFLFPLVDRRLFQMRH